MRQANKIKMIGLVRHTEWVIPLGRVLRVDVVLQVVCFILLS